MDRCNEGSRPRREGREEKVYECLIAEWKVTYNDCEVWMRTTNWQMRKMRLNTRLVEMNMAKWITNFITLRAKLCDAVYCYRSCLWRAGACVCECVCGCVCVCGSVTMITRNCVHRSSPNDQTTKRFQSVGKASDISSWLNSGGPAPPVRGSAAGQKN